MTLKEQALEHWRENLKRLKAMNWSEWCGMDGRLRRHEILDAASSYAPQIGGRHCSFCQFYSENCHVTTSGPSPACMTHARCPLYDITIPGRCCKEWESVRDALLRPTTKSAASRAINKMIKRLEAL